MAPPLERWVLGTRQGEISQEDLEHCLDESTFRFNRRTSRYRGKLFCRRLQQAIQTEPTPYHKLSRGIRPGPKGKRQRPATVT